MTAPLEQKVRDWVDAWNRSDIDGVIRDFQPDAELDMSRRAIDPSVVRTRAEMEAFRKGFHESWGDSGRFEVERFYELEDGLLVLISIIGTGQLSGVPVRARVAYRVTVRDGVFTRVEYFPDREVAFEELGTEPPAADESA